MTNDDCVRIFDNILGLRPISALNHCKESKATTLCGLKCVSHYLPLLPYKGRLLIGIMSSSSRECLWVPELACIEGSGNWGSELGSLPNFKSVWNLLCDE